MSESITLYIPCFNGSATLGPCLESVFSQTVRPTEVIVVDDCSTDGSLDICGRYPVRLIRHERNLGLSCARNSAVRAAEGELVAALDADCVADSRWLEYLLAEMSGERAAGAGGRLDESSAATLADLWRARHMAQHWGERRREDMPFLFGNNTLFRRSVVVEAGFYDERLSTNYEDVDLCRRLRERGYTLVYQPAARVIHYKRDRLASIFLAFWRWNKEYYRTEGFYRDRETLIDKVRDNIGLANRLMDEDAADGKHELLYLDFLLALHHSFMDMMYYLSGGDALAQGADERLLCWLTVIDLSFSAHYNHDRGKLTSFLGRENATRVNLFTFLLTLGGFLCEEFGEKARRTVSGHLLVSAGMKEDHVLMETLDRLWRRRQTLWPRLLDRAHPLIDGRFIEALGGGFREWAIRKKKDIAGLEEAFASSMDTIDREVAAHGN